MRLQIKPSTNVQDLVCHKKYTELLKEIYILFSINAHLLDKCLQYKTLQPVAGVADESGLSTVRSLEDYER